MGAPIGLYYPYTHFRDPGWLKTAALYWPRMARMAPLGYADADRDTRALRDELDFVLDLDPGDRTRDAVARKALDAFAAHGGRLRERYGIPERTEYTVGGASSAGGTRVAYRFPELGGTVTIEEPTRRWPRPVPAPHPETFRRLIGLHSGKLDRLLRGTLHRHHMAALDDTGEYAAVHPNFAWAYMCMLADEMAQDQKLVPVADEPVAYADCGAWSAERFAAALLDRDPPDADPDRRAALATLALRVAVPADAAAVPVGRIIAVRRRYGAELDAFRGLVGELAAEVTDELDGVTDARVVAAYLDEAVARRVERPLAELRRAMRGLGVETALSAASVKVEVPAAAALAAGWAAGQPAVAAAGAAFGLATWYRGRHEARRDRVRASPVGYLWRIERGLTGPQLLRSGRTAAPPPRTT